MGTEHFETDYRIREPALMHSYAIAGALTSIGMYVISVRMAGSMYTNAC